MPKVRKRVTNRGVPLEILHQASDKIKDDGRTVRAVAKDFNICHTTLFRFHKKREKLASEGSDKLPNTGYWTVRKVFSNDQEKKLTQFLEEAADLFYGLSPKEVRTFAFQLASHYNCNFPSKWIETGMAGVDWFTNFLKRHPTLSIRRHQSTRLSKATTFDRTDVYNFFDNLSKGLCDQSPPGKQGTTKTNGTSATVSSDYPLSQPTTVKLQKNLGNQFENECLRNRDQKAVIHSVQSCLTDPVEMQLEPHPQLVAPLPVTTQPVTKEKQIFIVADHQHCVMSSLASLWKNGKLCDAGIGNGSSTVMVHKLVLSAICPKLLIVSNMDVESQEFLQVNFPKEVSEEALNAFAEYMYNGILDLDPDILEQMKIIARRLDMTEFEQLCDSHLSNHIHQPASSSFTNVPLIQTMQIPAMTSSSSCSFGSTNFTQSTTPVIDNQQKISAAEVQKKPVGVFSQQADVMASLGPHKSEDAAGFVINPSVKIEPIGPEDDQQSDHWRSRSNNCHQDLTSSNISSITDAASSSITSVPSSSSTEFAIPSSEITDVKSTRLKRKHSSYKAPHSSKAPHVSNSMNKNFSKSIGQPSNTVTSADLPTRNNTVYPVSLVAANGHNLPFTTETADVMTVNSFMPSEKT